MAVAVTPDNVVLGPTEVVLVPSAGQIICSWPAFTQV
jgi:hypothetical protein